MQNSDILDPFQDYKRLELRKAIFSPEMSWETVLQCRCTKSERLFTLPCGFDLWYFQKCIRNYKLFRCFGSMKTNRPNQDSQNRLSSPIVCPFVIFLLVIVVPVLLIYGFWFPFVIFKLFPKSTFHLNLSCHGHVVLFYLRNIIQ